MLSIYSSIQPPPPHNKDQRYLSPHQFIHLPTPTPKELIYFRPHLAYNTYDVPFHPFLDIFLTLVWNSMLSIYSSIHHNKDPFNRINKGVDGLHIKNHVRHSCRNEYPKVIQDLRNKFSSPNTEAAEQTFLWLGKFKKIINSMDKRKHHFFYIV